MEVRRHGEGAPLRLPELKGALALCRAGHKLPFHFANHGRIAIVWRAHLRAQPLIECLDPIHQDVRSLLAFQAILCLVVT